MFRQINGVDNNVHVVTLLVLGINAVIVHGSLAVVTFYDSDQMFLQINRVDCSVKQRHQFPYLLGER